MTAMKSFRLRLDVGTSAQHQDDVKPPPFETTATTATTIATSNNNDSKLELDIPYDDNTTIATLLRFIIEGKLLGGHLLEFLEAQSDGRREEVYVLIYSKKESTLVQPYWQSSRSTSSSEKNQHQHQKQQLLLQLSFHDGQSDRVIKPKKNVSSFVRKYSKRRKKINAVPPQKKKRKLNDDDCITIEMKLRAVRCQGYKPTNINICMCEEHWRQRHKILSTNLLSQKPPSVVNKCKRKIGQHQALIKSIIIYNFLGKDRLLTTMALLIPTTLIMRGLDTFDAIQISVDKPSMCQFRVLNLKRPAVLRQYFGMNVDTEKPTGRDDVIWRYSYGGGSGARTVGIHPKHSTTREMTYPMQIIGEEVYQYLKAKFGNDSSVKILPFNHITVLLYYNKVDKYNFKELMLGYHTDNVFSHDGEFIDGANSQLENTFTVLVTLGDKREVDFRRQILELSQTTNKKKWVNDTNTPLVSFVMRNLSLFLLNPGDERPTQVELPDGPVIKRHQHGDVKFPYPDNISAVLALRTVTSMERVFKDSGKLYTTEQPATASTKEEPVVDFLMDRFRREQLLLQDTKLKELWCGVCDRHFNYQINNT